MLYVCEAIEITAPIVAPMPAPIAAVTIVGVSPVGSVYLYGLFLV